MPDVAAGLGADPGVTAVFERVVAGAVRAGATVVRVDLEPFLAVGELLYGGPWVAERLADLGPFLEAHPRRRPAGDQRGDRERTPVQRSGRLFAACTACRSCARAAPASGRTPTRCSCPRCPRRSRAREIADDPIGRNVELGRFTQFANLLDLAAVAIPAGTTGDGRPAGVTLLGPAFTEAALLDIARSTPAKEAA